MSLPSLDAVLSSPNLPTLPAVAWRVLELTRRPDVRLSEIADVVQNDPAITARILKTVNSSFYGLPSPCPTIARAIALLGLNAVKSLVLGFSLVDSVKQVGSAQSMDLTAYWRRSIHAASAARVLAEATGGCDPEEPFTAALLANVGLVALALSCPEPAAQLQEEAGGDHLRLAAAERTRFGFDHAMLSAALADRWRLPGELVLAVKQHHDPGPVQPISRLTALAELIAETLIGVNRSEARKALHRQAGAWFRIDEALVDALLSRIVEQASQVAAMFKVDVGEPVDVRRLLEEASDQLAAHQVTVARETLALRSTNDELLRQTVTDALTRARNRRFFDEAVSDAFLAASTSGGRVAVIMCDADRFKSVNDTHGHGVGDQVLIEIASRLRSVVREGDHVCRYGGEEVAVILPGAGRREAAALSERLRHRVGASPFTVHSDDGQVLVLPVTASFGVAALDEETRGTITDVAGLTGAADRALYAAKGAGRNCTRVFLAGGANSSSRPDAKRRSDQAQRTPDHGDAHPRRWMLVVEDDPAFARIAERAFASNDHVEVRVARSGEDALMMLSGGRDGREPGPDVVVADLQLPGLSGVDLVRAMRAHDQWRAMPVIMLTGSPSDASRRECFSAGANLYVAKQSLGDNPVSRLREIIDLWRAAA